MTLCRLALLPLLCAFVLACQPASESSPSTQPAASRAAEPAPSPTTETTPAPVVADKSAPQTPWVKLGPKLGSLEEQLVAHIARADEQSLQPIVYLGATWCGPCKVIKQNRSHPLMVETFLGIYVVELDFDEWPFEQLSQLGYGVNFIPMFFQSGLDGRAAGPKISGNAWENDTPENISAALSEFFRGLKKA